MGCSTTKDLTRARRARLVPGIRFKDLEMYCSLRGRGGVGDKFDNGELRILFGNGELETCLVIVSCCRQWNVEHDLLYTRKRR